MKVFKNKNYTQRNYECTNVIACVSEQAPSDDWIAATEDAIKGLTRLWIEKDVAYYGHL